MELLITLTNQGRDGVTATVSFSPEGDVKRKIAAVTKNKKATPPNIPIKWDDIDSDFLHLTVLHAPDDAQVE